MNEMKSAGPDVTRLIVVDPDQLIDIGQRLKQAAMDSAYPGESVLIPFSQGITLVYHPEREFLKPVHKIGVQNSAQRVSPSEAAL